MKLPNVSRSRSLPGQERVKIPVKEGGREGGEVLLNLGGVSVTPKSVRYWSLPGLEWVQLKGGGSKGGDVLLNLGRVSATQCQVEVST